MPEIAVLGASGHTGRLVVDALRRRGAKARPLARSTGGPDVKDRAAVRKAIEGCDAVADLAGPFEPIGLAPAQAAIDAGIPYVDTTGEQTFMVRVRDALDVKACDAGVPLVQALAFEYAFGDLAAKRFFPDGGSALHILYRSLRTSPSAGTKKSVARVLGSPTLSYENGKVKRVHAARYQMTFATSAGKRLGVSFAGGEVLTVPRHTAFDTVRTYIQTKPSNARFARPLGVLARVALRGPVLRMVERRIDAQHKAPDNERAGGEVHLIDERSGRHVLVRTPDPYLATAESVAYGAIELARGGTSSRQGWLAPAEAFDPAAFLDAMENAMPEFSAGEFTPGSPKA
jgi:short subunit dehydrogenase-like uncharacterized protein